MSRTLDETIRDCTEDYLSKINLDNPPTPKNIAADLTVLVEDKCMLANQIRPRGNKLNPPPKLIPSQVAMIMLHMHNIVRIATCDGSVDSEYDLLAIYNDNECDEDRGIYITDETAFKQLAIEYCWSFSDHDLNEVISRLRISAKRVSRTADPDLIAVNNGIFNYATKELLPFSPNYYFLAKSKVNYNPQAINIVIHNDVDNTEWDVESWMEDLSDDPEVVELLWEILSAIIRPFVRWNKSAWLYSETGNNGKGTLCELMRNLCGKGSFAAIPLESFSKDFALEPLTRATAIIVDENDVGCFIDKAANLKAVITNDVVPINRKFKTPISFQFYGFMVQCLNEFPRIKDRSDSFYRRQIFIPFDRCFTGVERKYIKNDYLKRKEVLEYVLFRVLNTNFYTLSEPLSCKNTLDE